MDYSNLLMNIVAKATPSLRRISSEKFKEKSNKYAWSKKEIIGHLIDSAYCNHRRLVNSVMQENLIFSGYDQDAWVRVNAYQNRNHLELINIWGISNQHLATLIDNIPENILTKSTANHNFDKICMNRIPSGETTTLHYLTWDYLFHVEHHLVQLLPSYQKVVLPYSTNTTSNI